MSNTAAGRHPFPPPPSAPADEATLRVALITIAIVLCLSLLLLAALWTCFKGDHRLAEGGAFSLQPSRAEAILVSVSPTSASSSYEVRAERMQPVGEESTAELNVAASAAEPATAFAAAAREADKAAPPPVAAASE